MTPEPKDDSVRVTRCGKEVFLDGVRIADAATEKDAEAIVLCMTYLASDWAVVPPKVYQFLTEYFE